MFGAVSWGFQNFHASQVLWGELLEVSARTSEQFRESQTATAFREASATYTGMQSSESALYGVRDLKWGMETETPKYGATWNSLFLCRHLWVVNTKTLRVGDFLHLAVIFFWDLSIWDQKQTSVHHCFLKVLTKDYSSKNKLGRK